MPTELIKSQLSLIPPNPGVYRFFNSKNEVIYVGKAKNLFKRVSSYTKENQLSRRISRMIFLAQKVEIIQTESEVEALLLEHNLIKKFQPRFNILLRDDKTFPQILITNHQFPQITKYRGGNDNKGSHFGPFANTRSVNHTIDVLRKIFRLRNCSDAEFKLRQKPCLEFQIKRCLAPCVAKVSSDEYKIAVGNAIDFLKGKTDQVQEKLTAKMQQFSAAQNYESAANVRDQINALNDVQTKQNININEIKDADVITIVESRGSVCIYVAFFRASRSLGAKPYFYEIEEDKKLDELLSEFLGQFYLDNPAPSLILLNLELSEKKLLEMFLAKKNFDKKTEIITPKRGVKLALLQDQEKLARQNLDQKILQNLNNKKLLLEVKKIFNLPKIPKRIEVYDNSHTQTTNAVGALITAGVDGFIKSGYRKFNLRFDLSQNRDDTAMMREVFMRRFSKLKKAEYPDLIIIDGGKGQMNAAQEIFDYLKVSIPFICMSKGENRNAGEEVFHQINQDSFTLPKTHPVMYYLQRLRDEAHRFAIMTHRKKRDKAMVIF